MSEQYKLERAMYFASKRKTTKRLTPIGSGLLKRKKGKRL